jgi:hypothetical protein
MYYSRCRRRRHRHHHHHQAQSEKPPVSDLKQFLPPPKILRDNGLYKADLEKQ